MLMVGKNIIFIVFMAFSGRSFYDSYWMRKETAFGFYPYQCMGMADAAVFCSCNWFLLFCGTIYKEKNERKMDALDAKCHLYKE